ncbi:WD40 repeat domain-containing protein [Amorphus sp. 3PC139-8]|uniref:WD40 repeat domain-containing protein n=1 Tax=Amorphus sp. 3PC139-8 TaxID=2735676 RepID=UPI00345CF30A
MNQQPRANVTLYDLLAREWACEAAVSDACFSHDGSVTAFSLDDGTVALAVTADEEPPQERIRMTPSVGKATIRPRSAPPRPLIKTTVLSERPMPIVATHDGVFLAGTSAGEVRAIDADGAAHETPLAFDGPVTALDHRADITAASDGTRIQIARDGQARELEGLAGGAVGCLALSSDASRLAVAEGNTVRIIDLSDSQKTSVAADFPAAVTGMAWSGDGRWIACPLETSGFGLIEAETGRSALVGGYPGPVATAAFSTAAHALVTSGAFRITAWSTAELPFDDAKAGVLETGRRGLVVIDRIAVHPTKKLVAAAYENGQIVIAQIGHGDELVLRPSGAPVTALAWAPDGKHLSIGDGAGKAALSSFPPQIFK